MKANDVTEVANYEYAIKPLTVYSKSDSAKAEMAFDDYGNLTKMNSESTDEEVKSTYKLSAKYTYEKK